MGKMLSPRDVPAIVTAFIEREVAPHGTGLQKAMAFGAAFIMQRRAPEIIAANEGRLKALGLMTDDGMLDLDMIHEMLAFSLQKAGKVEVAGVLLSEEDVHKMYDLASQLAR